VRRGKKKIEFVTKVKREAKLKPDFFCFLDEVDASSLFFLFFKFSAYLYICMIAKSFFLVLSLSCLAFALCVILCTCG